jgi:hypothetical protein
MTMADNEWLKDYTPVDTVANAAAPATATQTSPTEGVDDHSWLSAFKPVEPATPAQNPSPSIADTVVNKAFNGLLGNYWDEAGAAIDAGLKPLTGDFGNPGSNADAFSQRYEENLATNRAALKAGAEQNPVISTAAELAGGIIPAIATGGASAPATLGAAVARGALTGAAYGGVYGSGGAEGDLTDRLKEGAQGAAIGAALGGAVPAAIAGVSSVARRAADAGAARLGNEAASDATNVNASALAPTAGSQPAANAADEATQAIVKAANAPKSAQELAQGNLAAVVNPQQNVLDAAARLGVDGLTPAQVSGSQAYRNIEGALSAIPGSALNEQKKTSYLQLAQKADDFINDFGGNTDKAAYSDQFKRNATQTIDGLKGQADDLYGYIGQQIPKTTQAPADNTIAYIQGKMAELGGAPLLNADERKALNILAPKVRTEPNPLIPGTVQTITTNPTYGALDLVRKQVGQGYSRSGPFKDMQQGQLDALYSTLTRDQEALVNSVSPELGSVYQGAKSIVAQRKGLEEGLQAVLGKDLSGSIATSLGSSVKQLSQGNFKNFDNIIQHIPEASRQDAIVTALNDAFTNKSGAQKQLSASGFVNWYGDLNRNTAARARLIKYLPDDAQKRLDDIYTVAKAMKDASDEVVKTGVSLGVLKDYAAQGGLLSRIWDVAKPAAAAEGVTSSLGLPGVGAIGVIANAAAKPRTPIQESAGNLLASPQFQNMVKAYAASGGNLRANVLAREKQLVRTQAYRKWESNLSEASRQSVKAAGPLAYLTAGSSE